MKQTLIAAVLLLACAACHKENSNKTTSAFMNEATIKGPNLTMPPCGGQYMIVIHGITDSSAQFDSLPHGSSIALDTATFPLNIRLNWHHSTGTECDTLSNIITIDSMQVE